MCRVSVIVPAYNQGRFLRAALESALAQTFAAFEILVVDDGSTDDTPRVAAAFKDRRVRYIRQENKGLSAARNTGIRQSRGSLLTFLDSDDLFFPEKLELLCAAMDERPGVGLVAGQAVLIDEAGNAAGEVFDRGLPANPSDLLLGNPLHVGSVLLRKEWQERVGLFDESLRSYEDWDMWLRLARAGCRFGWVPRPVSQYRFHRSQMTRSGDQMTRATFAVLDKTFRDPDLSPSWQTRRDEAYARGFLRAAAQAYTSGEFGNAARHMTEAVRLSPGLCANGAETLARLAAGWANHTKNEHPLAFLTAFYDHLPEELSVLRRRRRSELGSEAGHLAFAAYRRGDMAAARSTAWRAIGYRPRLLLNRGVLSVLVRATLSPWVGSNRGD